MKLTNKKLIINACISLILWTATSCQLFSQTQIGTTFSGESARSYLGSSVSISGDGSRVAIGATGNENSKGNVAIYDLIHGEWKQVGSTIEGQVNGGEFGYSVSLSENGERVVIGTVGYDDYRGAVQVFGFENGDWTQVGKTLYGEAQSDEFGSETSISWNGNKIAIGAPGNSNNAYASGQVKVYVLVIDNWSLMGKFEGEEMRDEVGSSVSLSGNGLTVAFSGASSVKVYEMLSGSGSWKQLGDSIADASTVALSSLGNTIAVGVYSSGEYMVKVFNNKGSNWEQRGSTLVGEKSDDMFGRGVALTPVGLRLAVGAGRNDGNGVDAGHVRIYDFKNDTWTQIGSDIDGDAAGDRSGEIIALSADGESLIVGTIFNDKHGEYSGQARVFNIDGQNTNSSRTTNIQILLSPNPTSGMLLITGLEPTEVRVLNCFGQVVFSEKFTGNELDITTLVKGVYIVQMVFDGELYSKRLIKK